MSDKPPVWKYDGGLFGGTIYSPQTWWAIPIQEVRPWVCPVCGVGLAATVSVCPRCIARKGERQA